MIKRNFTKRGVGEPYLSTSITGRSVNYSPNRRTCNRKESWTSNPNRKQWTWHLLQETDYPSSLAHEKPSSPALLLLSNGLQFKTTPPRRFLLHKITRLSFVYGTCLWFCRNLHVPNCSSSAVPKETHFAGEITGCLRLTTPTVEYCSAVTRNKALTRYNMGEPQIHRE